MPATATMFVEKEDGSMIEMLSFTNYSGEMFRIGKLSSRQFRVWKVEDQDSSPGIEVEALAFFGDFESRSFKGAANAARSRCERTRTCR